MLKLPNVTLVAMTGKDIEAHTLAITKSCKGLQWGAVKRIFPTNAEEKFAEGEWLLENDNLLKNTKGDFEIKNIDEWNNAIIYELPKYIETSYAFLIHADGYPINPHLWNPEWLELDYIGAPWPLPQDDYSYRSESGRIIRVGNSVSLRSKRLMERVTQFEWKSYYGNTNEDGFISCHHRDELEAEGFKFATLEEAVHFSKEHEIPENEGIETFAFHSL